MQSTFIGAELGQCDCFSPCSWWMRLASEGGLGFGRCHRNVRAKKGCSQNLIVIAGSRCEGQGVVSRHLGALRTAKPLTWRAPQREVLGSYGASAFGNSAYSTAVEVSTRKGKNAGCEKGRAGQQGKCRADGRAGERRGGRRSSATVRGGCSFIGNVKMWMRGMTNWRAPLLGDLVIVPVSQTCTC
jgi:hypothetical protein